jgi:hypothetical protein
MLIWFWVLILIRACYGVKNKIINVFKIFLDENKLKFRFWKSENSDPVFLSPEMIKFFYNK